MGKHKERFKRGILLMIFLAVWSILTSIIAGIVTSPILILLYMVGVNVSTPTLPMLLAFQLIYYIIFLIVSCYVIGLVVPYLPLKDVFRRKLSEAERDRIF